MFCFAFIFFNMSVKRTVFVGTMYKIRQIQNYNFKIHVVFCTVSCCINIIHFCNFIINTFLYGSTDLSVNIQSISEFRNCTLTVTAGQFLILFAFAKIMGTFVISSFLALVFIIFSSSATMYLTGLVIIGAEYLLYTLIGQNSFLNLLKYINIFYILDGGNFWKLSES